MSIWNRVKQGDSFSFIKVFSIFSIIFIILYMVFTGNTNQIYNDIVIEWTSMVSANKSAEMFLLYFLCFGGILAYTIWYILIKYNNNNKETISSQINLPKVSLFVIGIITLFQSTIIFNWNIVLFALFIYTVLSYLKDKDNLINNVIFFFLNLYFIYALYRIIAFCGLNASFNPHVATIFCLFFSSVIFIPSAHKNRNIITSKIILIEQVFLPGLLLVYLTNKYNYNNKILMLDVLPQIKFVIFVIIGILLFEAFYLLKNNWNFETPLKKILSFGACISISGFNLFNFVGRVVPSDLHHPFENIIGFNQIFQLGQTPFKEYIPVSGMYSIVHGAFFQLFGNGEISQIFISDSVGYLIISIIVLFLIKQHVDKTALFLYSVCAFCIFYDRIVLILPTMLLLSLPKLVENKTLWLKVWLLTSLFHGLYYPVFGAAVCLAFVPLAIFQLITYILTDNYKKDIKTIKFWAAWGLSIIPIIISLPFLVGTYTHIKTMADQTICADGISRFGQSFGNTLLPYLSANSFYKSILVYILTFIIPTLFIVIAFALSLRLFNIKKNSTESNDSTRNGCLALSLVIMPLVAYSYTFVRLDVGTLYARNAGVFLAGITMMIIYALNYVNDKKTQCKLICFALCIPMFSSLWGFTDNNIKLKYYYNIDNNYKLVKNDTIPKLDIGFIDNSVYNYLKNLKIQDKASNYFAVSFFGPYYIYDIRGASVLESQTIKSYKAAKETILNLLSNNAIVGTDYSAISNYYLHYWLLTSGKYIYDDTTNYFYPNNNQYSNIEVRNKNNMFNAPEELYLGLNSSSLGLSFNSLSSIFADTKIDFNKNQLTNSTQILFKNNEYGNNIDFLYLEFKNMNKSFALANYDMAGFYAINKNQNIAKFFTKNIYNPSTYLKISWFDNNKKQHELYTNMGQGKLLIPLGAGNKWLLNYHKELNINVYQNGKEIKTPEINVIKFLKLREVNTNDE